MTIHNSTKNYSRWAATPWRGKRSMSAGVFIDLLRRSRVTQASRVWRLKEWTVVHKEGINEHYYS